MVGILDESVEPASFLEAPDKWQYMIDLLRPIISKALIALIVLLIGFIVGKVIGKTIQWFLRLADFNRRWKDFTGINWRIEEIISGCVSVIIYFIGIVMALNVLGITAGLASIVSYGIISLIFISLFLAINDFLPNFISGFTIAKRLKHNDTILVDTIKGKIAQMTWTDVKIVAENGDTLYIPHSLFLKKGFKQYR